MAVRKSTLRKRVRRGIEFLNERRPSWLNSISVNQLDLASCELCVLGQLYSNNYVKGLRILNGEVAKHPEKFGFDFDQDRDEYEQLTEIWAEEIAIQRKLARQDKQVVKEAESFLSTPAPTSATL